MGCICVRGCLPWKICYVWINCGMYSSSFLANSLKVNSHRADKRQQTSRPKLAVGFRILWKITHVHTASTDTKRLSLTGEKMNDPITMRMFSRVKTISNQLQPTPTGVTHWSNRLVCWCLSVRCELAFRVDILIAAGQLVGHQDSDSGLQYPAKD